MATDTGPGSFAAHIASLPTSEVLDLAFEMTQERLTPPTPDLYALIERQVDFMRGFDAVGVAPTDADRESISVGVIAVRNFEEVDPEYSLVLVEAAWRFRHRGAPR